MPYLPRQYDSAKVFLKNYTNLGNIIDKEDNARLQAYNLYEDFYFNRPDTFRVTVRGDSATEIYLPSTRKMVDATARFLAIDFGHTVTGDDQLVNYFTNLFARETLPFKFTAGKKPYLYRGDQCWYITADPNKPQGERISINTVHPSSVFRIEDPNNTSRVVGYHLVDIVADPREPADSGKVVARRQTFRKKGTQITSEAWTFEIGFWDDRHLKKDELKPVTRIYEEHPLPDPINQLPVYVVPNNLPDGSSWGLSQVAGTEYIINALNQSMTYEDLSLVLQGLGVYVTTAAPPTDKITGKPQKYKLHPGNVVEMSQGDTFERVTGVASVAPFQDHLKLLDEWACNGIGLPDMATGQVDVAVAQSGIALALKMGPIIAENTDKQLALEDKWKQIGYDLIKSWLPAYERISATGEFKPTFGDPMPLDRETYITETVTLWEADLITTDEARDRLEKVGYKKTSDLASKLLEQKAKKADAEGGSGLLNEGGATAPNLIDTFDS